MVGVIFRLLSLLPLWVMHALSSALWPVLYYMVRYRRAVVRRNLGESFPERSPAEIKRLERKFYRSFTDIVLESVKMATISPATIGRRMRFINAGEVAQTLEAGHSVSLYLGHLGNWEWVSSLPLHLPGGIVAGQVYHKITNRTIDRLLLTNRERMGAVCVEMHDVARRLNEWKERVSIVGYIADQSPKMRYIRHHVPFMNHLAPVLVGAEKLTRRYGCQAWFLDVRRVGRGRYEARFVRLDYDPSAEYGITDAYYKHLEEAVRRQPEAYLWTHNRFKHCEK